MQHDQESRLHATQPTGPQRTASRCAQTTRHMSLRYPDFPCRSSSDETIRTLEVLLVVENPTIH